MNENKHTPIEIGRRLREEREELGMSQVAFAKIGGVKRGSQLGYETGERSPNAEYLGRIYNIGADIQYIASGNRVNLVRESVEYIDLSPGIVVNGPEDLKLLSKVIEMVERARMKRPGLEDKDDPRIANAISIIYNAYRAEGNTPSDEAAAIMVLDMLLKISPGKFQ